MKFAVLILNNLSARWLGSYGNEWVSTPNLDRLAAEGIVIERHILDRIDEQSVMHTIQDSFKGRQSWDSCSDYYAGLGKGFKVRTAGEEIVVVECTLLEPPWDVPQERFVTLIAGFDIENAESISNPLLTRSVSDFDQWAIVRASYGAVLEECDEQVGELLDIWRSEGRTIIVTSNRGYPLGEHGVIGPAHSRMYSELVHVPLLIWCPENVSAGERVCEMSQPSKFWSCLVESSSQSLLLERFNGFLMAHENRAVTFGHSTHVGSIRTSNWTLLLADDGNDSIANAISADCSARLYAYPNDSYELNDLADREQELVEKLTLFPSS